MKTTFMFPLLGLFVEKQMRRFRITVRLYKSELCRQPQLRCD